MTGGAQGGLNLLHVTCYPMIQKCDVGGKLGKLENFGNKGKLDFLGLFSARGIIDLHKIFSSKKENKMSPGVTVDERKNSIIKYFSHEESEMTLVVKCEM